MEPNVAKVIDIALQQLLLYICGGSQGAVVCVCGVCVCVCGGGGGGNSSINPFIPSGLFYVGSFDRSISYIKSVWLVSIITISCRKFRTY